MIEIPFFNSIGKLVSFRMDQAAEWLSSIKPQTKKIILIAIFSIMSIYHISTLFAPGLNEDDVAATSFVLYGKVHTWKTPYPLNKRYYWNPDSLYYYSKFPLFVNYLQPFVKLFGPGSWQIKGSSLLFGLGSLLFMLLIGRGLKLPFASQIGVSLLGFSFLSFQIFHSSRPEPGILFIIVMNVYWLVLNKGRFWGFLSGSLASLALMLHPGIIIFYAALPFIVLSVDGVKFFKLKRYWWWLVGFSLGLVLCLYGFVDGTWASFLNENAVHIHLGKSVLQYQKWNIVELFFGAMDLTFHARWDRYQTLSFSLFCMALLTTLAWQVRRLKKLPSGEKLITWVALITLIAHGLISPRSVGWYQIQYMPWLWVVFFCVLSNLIFMKMKLDKLDLYLFVAVLMVAVLNFDSNNIWLLILPFLFYVLVSRGNVKLWIRIVLTLFCFFVIYRFLDGKYPNGLDGFISKISFLKGSVCLLWSFILFKMNKDGVQLRFFPQIKMEYLFVVFLSGILIFNLGAVMLLQKNYIATSPNLDPEFQQLKSVLTKQKKVYGLNVFWPYVPHVDWVSQQYAIPSPHIEPSIEFLRKETRQMILDHKPNYLLWPESRLFHLSEPDMSNLPPEFTFDRLWKTAYGSHLGFKIKTP